MKTSVCSWKATVRVDLLVNTFLGGIGGGRGDTLKEQGRDTLQWEGREGGGSLWRSKGGPDTFWTSIDMEGCDSLADEVVGAVIRRASRFNQTKHSLSCDNMTI